MSQKNQQGGQLQVGNDALYAAYWEVMPEWARRQYHQDGLTNHVVKRYAMSGEPVEKLGWELARVLTREREALRTKSHDLADRTSYVIFSANEKLSGSPGSGASPTPWQAIETLPRDGTPVLVWAEPMIYPDIAWHEASGGTLRTYTHWMPLPQPANA